MRTKYGASTRLPESVRFVTIVEVKCSPHQRVCLVRVRSRTEFKAGISPFLGILPTKFRPFVKTASYLLLVGRQQKHIMGVQVSAKKRRSSLVLQQTKAMYSHVIGVTPYDLMSGVDRIRGHQMMV